MNYYNENDPKAAQWLRNLISAGAIPPGHVDERSIADVQPADITGFTQCHFFAGIGGWPLALRLAGVSPSTPLWTGSCPCQPFSSAGKRRGTDDERHLWPVFRNLIAECRPPVVLGEQVASADGRAWLSTVRAEMEALAYAVGAADLCAAGIGAPHLRQRLYFVGLADTNSGRCQQRNEGQRDIPEPDTNCEAGRMAHAHHPRPQGRERMPQRSNQCSTGQSSVGGRVADADGRGCGENWKLGGLPQVRRATSNERVSAQSAGVCGGRLSQNDSFWSSADWLFCRDEKWRPVEPGTFPLAHGLPGRVAHLRGYGNAIVPQVAAMFICAALAERKTD